nr:MAG TPA: hypothetical protein [Caudoviricetes sp.]
MLTNVVFTTPRGIRSNARPRRACFVSIGEPPRPSSYRLYDSYVRHSGRLSEILFVPRVRRSLLATETAAVSLYTAQC